MTRFDLTLAFAGVLIVAFVLGWAAHWIWARLAREAAPRSDRADELAAELLHVEETRDRALDEVLTREAAAAAEAAAVREDLENRLREREAELAATMDGLRAARAEIEETRRG